ncbi:MAG: TonB-dependent receptor domain-containing protein [Bryobacteraceae bacterium]
MRFLAVRPAIGRKVLLSAPLMLGLALWTGLPPGAHAQIINGSIVGTITDPTGAVIQKSTVTATDTGTGLKRVVQTGAGGVYGMSSLAPGTYDVTATASGFRPEQKSQVVITPGATVRVNLQLQVGSATQEVSVSAMAVQLQTDKADTHTEITAENMHTLPLGGNRQYQALINLAPGTTQGAFANSNLDVPATPQATYVNGANEQTNTTRIDGIESVNMWLPRYPGFQVPAQDVDAVTVTTSASDAAQSYGGASSVSVVTKSGTNQIHGSALWFHNDQHLNARNFFLKGQKPVTIFNDGGGTIGGPIKKNKLFYFFSFDGTMQKTGANGVYTVPTADQRAGDFSAYDTQIYNPFTGTGNLLTGTADGTGRSLFPNNKIPTNLLSPQARKIQSYLPLPNQPGVVNNYSVADSPAVNIYRYDAKANWNPTQNLSMFFKYDNMEANSGGVGIFGIGGGPTPGSNPGQGVTSVNVAGIGATYILSPTMLMTGNLGYQRRFQHVLNTSYGTDYSSILGVPGLNGDDIRDSGFPNVNIGGYTALGTPSWMPLFRTDENYTGSVSLAVTKGKHQLRFGFDMVRFHLNHWQPELSAGGPRGYFDFGGSITTKQLANGNATNSDQFNSYAQFLLGLSDNTQKGEQYILMTTREWQFGLYAQDTWQVSQKLTVDLGLRYDLYPLMTRCCGTGIERLDPSTMTVYMGGRGDVPLGAGISVSHKLFAPRAGIAYRLGDKTVIRAGYGINFDPLSFGRPLRGFYPLTINDNYTSLGSFGVANLGSTTNFVPGTLANGIPPIVGPDLSTGLVPLDPAASERSPLQKIHRGYIQSYNFSIQRQLPEKILMSAAYVGTHTVHEFADYDINSGFPGSGTTGLPEYATFGRTTATNMWDGYLSSEYNSLQATFNRQFASGLMLKGSYTWAHAIDYADTDGWTGVNWNWNPVFQRNRASAGFDQRQTFQLGWVYALPFGPGKKFVSSGVMSHVLGDWQLSGIEACHTGTPLFLSAPGTSLNDGHGNSQTPNQVMASVPLLGGVGPGAHYYDPAAFAPVTAADTFGTVGRNILAGPGLWNTDLSISRIFQIKERMKFEFRAEFYNLPNTSHFDNPHLGVTSSDFMQVTGAYGERNIRFGGMLTW